MTDPEMEALAPPWPDTPGGREEKAHAERMAAEMARHHPLIGNVIMPHVWNSESPGGICRRCGADYPTTDSCP